MLKRLSLAELPIELIDGIARCLDSDLVALCRTNRLLDGVCLRWIYRTVILDDAVRAVQCFRTLTFSIPCAHTVRNLVIQFRARTILQAFARVITAALHNLKYLESVDVSAHPDILHLMSDIHFPRLRLSSIPFSIDIIPFLELHPQLSGLSLDPVPHASVLPWTSLQPLHLPDLERFCGPPIVALSVIPHSRTTHITIFWDLEIRPKFSDTFMAIARCRTELIEVRNIRGGLGKSLELVPFVPFPPKPTSLLFLRADP
ncbi:hypothetical protein B0H14DRAFT_3437959 [Mycena olivaceomarginata]|nr:hypothetical protein B0H14DRAFT_3437959 [Mycena olivaceomarginata]